MIINQVNESISTSEVLPDRLTRKHILRGAILATALAGSAVARVAIHDDAEREWAYGAASKIGTFSDALMAEAKQQGWIVISMKNDGKRIFAFEPRATALLG